MKHQKEMEQLEKNQREQLEKLEKFNEQVQTHANERSHLRKVSKQNYINSALNRVECFRKCRLPSERSQLALKMLKSTHFC